LTNVGWVDPNHLSREARAWWVESGGSSLVGRAWQAICQIWPGPFGDWWDFSLEGRSEDAEPRRSMRGGGAEWAGQGNRA